MKLLDVTKLIGAQLGKILLSDQMKALVHLFLPAWGIRVETMAAICDCELTNIRKEALTTRMAEQKDTKSLGALRMLLSLWTKSWSYHLLSVQFSSVAQSCLTLCNPMNCSTPGLPVHHQLPEFTQTHIHRVSYAIQPSHPLSSPSPPALSLPQRQGLFQ